MQAQRAGEAAFIQKPASLVVGPQVTRVNLQLGTNHRMLCVAFQPGGLYRFLGMPMQGMCDQDFDTLDIVGSHAREVNEQLMESEDGLTAKNIVEQFMLTRLNRVKSLLPVDLALKELIQSGGALPVDKLASLACLSVRQFERVCKDRLGLSPKLFARLTRFSFAYRMREMHPQVSWTHIAHSAGYYDQMHLIKDFKTFAGVTPRIMEEQINAAPWRLQAGQTL